jgi:enterochelin esterase-like enzyme
VRVRLLIATVVIIGAIGFFSIPTLAPVADKRESASLALIERGELAVPVIRGQTITFYAQGDGGVSPRLVSDLTGWGERADGTFDFAVGKMHQLAGTNWFSLTASASTTARIEYLFSYGAGDYRRDPRNPRTAPRTGGDASEVVMPGYLSPREFAEPPVAPAGKITETMVPGAIVGKRRVIVYTPPGYDPATKYPLAVFHDGALVVNTGEAPRVLDWLIAHDEIHPIVAAFVDPVSRTDDFRHAAPMRDFVATELMAWIAKRYSITPLAEDHAIIGISAGARAALDAMASYPGVYGECGLMIAALDPPDVTTIPVKQDDALQLQVTVLAAAYDPLNHRSSELVRDALKARGHAVKYIEVAEGHSTQTWKNHLHDVLISLFGR